MIDIYEALDKTTNSLATVIFEVRRLLKAIPVIYHLDDGEYYVAKMIKEGSLILDMAHPSMHKYIGKPDWFSTDYVENLEYLVPEHCSQGTNPGEWEYPEDYINRIKQS